MVGNDGEEGGSVLWGGMLWWGLVGRKVKGRECVGEDQDIVGGTEVGNAGEIIG